MHTLLRASCSALRLAIISSRDKGTRFSAALPSFLTSLSFLFQNINEKLCIELKHWESSHKMNLSYDFDWLIDILFSI